MFKKNKSIKVLDTTLGVLLAEFVGTFGLAFAVLASINGVLLPFVPTAAIAGVALGVSVLAIGNISGSHINPAVTIGLLSIGRIKGTQAIAYIAAQVVAAAAAISLMTLLLEGEAVTLEITESDSRIFLGELIGAAVFGAGVASAAYQKLRGVEAGALIGGSLFIGIIVASVVSAGVINPAVAFTIDAISLDYIIGPPIGAIFGMNLVALIDRYA